MSYLIYQCLLVGSIAASLGLLVSATVSLLRIQSPKAPMDMDITVRKVPVPEPAELEEITVRKEPKPVFAGEFSVEYEITFTHTDEVIA